MRARGELERVVGADICVPPPKLAEVVKYAEGIFEKVGIQCLIGPHISGGNCHANIPFSTEVERRQLRGVERRMIKRAVKLGGTIPGERGLGVSRVEFVEQGHGPVPIAVPETIKAALDKDNLVSPGVFYQAQQLLFFTTSLQNPNRQWSSEV